MNTLIHFSIPSRIIIALTILISFSSQAQDPGFFMDDWQERSAEIPDYEMRDKPAGVATVTVTVDIDHVVNKVPTYIYGNNAVCWGGNMNEHATVMTDINNLNPHVLRWPGGSLSDAYFWNRASNQRPADIPQLILPDITNPWYGVNDDNWQMSTNDYYDLLANTNSTGIIVVNYGYARYGTGPNPVANAAHMAAEWVRYDNGRSKFWEIGNENFGSWEAGARIDTSLNQDGQPEYISGQLYGQHCRVFIDSMRAAAAETGADIKIGVVAFDAESVSWDPVQTVWNEQMMSEVGHLADFLSVHSYFTPYAENSTDSTILNSHHVPADIMSVLASDMAEAGKPMLPVAFTEWNIFAVGSMQQVSYINGMHSALVLGEFVKNNYGLATRWDLTNGWADGDDHGMFSRGGEPGVDYYNPRPVFFYMYYFQKYFGDRMVQTSVSGSDDVVAYGSSFASGETGMVLINKGLSNETAIIEMDNYEPGLKYYYHVLTGGDDNGDFSRKVFLNGYGTDEEGGGPDEYETIRAFASEVEGGIKVNLPPLSVVYLLVDKKPPPSHEYSKIDTNAKVICVRFSDPVILAENPGGFEVTAQETISLAVNRIEGDSTDASRLFIFLDQDVLPSYEVTLSYSGDDIMDEDSAAVLAFSDVPVENLLPGAVPKLKDVFTNSEGSTIHLLFNMGMNVSGPSPDSIVLMITGEPGQTIALSSIHVDDSDSNEIVITHDEPVYAEYDLILSYSGTVMRSDHNTQLEPFDSVPVRNMGPGLPPELVNARVSESGYSIHVLFNKFMNDLSGYKSLFTVRVNSEIRTIDAIHSAADSMIISLNDLISYADTLTLSYEGSDVTAVDRGELQAIENYPVDNTLPAPTIFNIPGMIDAELFSVNNGMVLEPCSDTGGGNNLGDVDAGDWLEYEVNISNTGYYSGNLRVAALSTSQLVIQTPDADVLDRLMIVIRPTGGLQEWTSLPLEMILDEGRQRLRLSALTSNFNINWLELEYDRTIQANVVSASTSETGDTIEIVFDREMALPDASEYSSFSVLADGNPVNISRLNLNNKQKNILLLILESLLTPDTENITVTYEAGNLMAADQIPVESFSDIQVSNNVITQIEPHQIPGIVFYPNPTNNHITIESKKSTITAVEIVDITGKRILYRHLESPRQTLTLYLKAAPGMYLLKIVSGNHSYSSKLVID